MGLSVRLCIKDPALVGTLLALFAFTFCLEKAKKETENPVPLKGVFVLHRSQCEYINKLSKTFKR